MKYFAFILLALAGFAAAFGNPTSFAAGRSVPRSKLSAYVDEFGKGEEAAKPAKAPSATLSVYDEAAPTLYMSSLVYTITSVLKKSMSGELNLVIPEDFEIENLERFLEESIDLTEYNNGNGMSFSQIDDLIQNNREELLREFGDEDGENVFDQTVIRRIRENLSSEGMTEDPMKKVFLTHHRSVQRDVACVYTVVKDTINKRIIASFRGSISINDWLANVNARLIGMETPDKIRNKMEDELQERLLVHRGFYEYLFDNDKIRGDQRYDSLITDIRNAMNGEEGYSVYVTGHSLGGALATIFSLKLAGAGSSFDDIPRPITCITWAAPFSGTEGYRTAMENLEYEGLIRHIRINNEEDLVPTVPFISFGRKRQMKHTGINLRLKESGFMMEHSSRSNIWTAFRNSIFKPVFSGALAFHGLELHEGRLENIAEDLKGMKLDDLYKDETTVSKEFIEGQIR